MTRWTAPAFGVCFALFYLLLPQALRPVLEIDISAQSDSVAYVYYRSEDEAFATTRYVFVAIPNKQRSAKINLPENTVEASLVLDGQELRKPTLKAWRLYHKFIFAGLKFPIAEEAAPKRSFPIANGLRAVPLGHEQTIALWQLRFIEALLWTLVVSFVVFPLTLASPARREAVTARRGALGVSVLLGLLVVLAVASWFTLRTRPAPQWPKYKLHLVDRQGFSLSGYRGGIYVLLDPFTSFRNVPNYRGEYYSTDEHGYRRSLRAEKQAPLAIVLGSSAAFGWGIEDDYATFTGRLNEINPQFKFYNAAVSSWHSAQELSEMVHYADALKPKLYMSVHGFNDLFFRDSQGAGFNRAMVIDVEKRLKELLEYKRWESVRLTGPAAGKMRSDDELIERYLGNLEKMHAFARSRGARYVAILQPDVSSRATPVPAEVAAIAQRAEFQKFSHVDEFKSRYQKLAERTARFCREKGIPFLDLNREQRLTHSPEAIFLDWIHPTERGHRLIAEVINENLARLVK